MGDGRVSGNATESYGVRARCGGGGAEGGDYRKAGVSLFGAIAITEGVSRVLPQMEILLRIGHFNLSSRVTISRVRVLRIESGRRHPLMVASISSFSSDSFL